MDGLFKHSSFPTAEKYYNLKITSPPLPKVLLLFFPHRINKSYWLLQLLFFWCSRLKGSPRLTSPCHICLTSFEESARSNTSVLNCSYNRHAEPSLFPHCFGYAARQVSKGGLHICLATQKRKLMSQIASLKTKRVMEVRWWKMVRRDILNPDSSQLDRSLPAPFGQIIKIIMK